MHICEWSQRFLIEEVQTVEKIIFGIVRFVVSCALLLFCFQDGLQRKVSLRCSPKVLSDCFVLYFNATFCYHCSCPRVNLVPWVFLVLLVPVVPPVLWVLLVQTVLLVKLVVM